MNRQKHQRADLEKILRAVEDAGWSVTRGKGYFKTTCTCVDNHIKWVALTPSGANYSKNLRKWYERQTCWPKKPPGSKTKGR